MSSESPAGLEYQDHHFSAPSSPWCYGYDITAVISSIQFSLVQFFAVWQVAGFPEPPESLSPARLCCQFVTRLGLQPLCPCSQPVPATHLASTRLSQPSPFCLFLPVSPVIIHNPPVCAVIILLKTSPSQPSISLSLSCQQPTAAICPQPHQSSALGITASL